MVLLVKLIVANVYVFTGSEYYTNGYTWGKIKFDKEEITTYWVENNT